VIRNGLGAGQVGAEARMEVKDDFQAGRGPQTTARPERARGPVSAADGRGARAEATGGPRQGPGKLALPTAPGRGARRQSVAPGLAPMR